MSKEKQIEEIAKDLYGYSIDTKEDCEFVATLLYSKGYRKQSVGEWKPFDFLHDKENEKNDWKRYACSLCGFITEAYYRDVRDSEYKFCPNCGAKMKGGE